MLHLLKSLNIDLIDIDDAVELVTFARLAEQTYTTYEVPAPGWLKDGINVLDREIKSRRRDMLHARQLEIAARLKSLKTRDEQKADLEAEQVKVNAALGITA